MKIRILPMLLVTVFLATACASSGALQSGRVPTEEMLVNIKNGQSTREDVTQLLGTPLRKFNFSAFNDEVWEYRSTSGTTYMVLSVHFDSRNGKVTSFLAEPDARYYSIEDNGS
jgi:outer membrane protein assembly factor BamE (lipoprotein component of BamABCDE complex)